MDIITNKYLIEFFEYLDEKSFDSLLYMILGESLNLLKRICDITCKELYLSILLNQIEEMLNLKKYNIEEVLSDKKRFEDKEYQVDFDEEYKKKMYVYLQTIFYPIPFAIVNEEMVKEWIEKYNTMISIIQISRNIILSQVSIIAKYIEHYQIKSTYRKDFVYKNLLNKLVVDIVKNRLFCFLYPDHVTQVRFEPYQEGSEFITTKEYKLIYKNDFYYITDNKQCEVNTKISDKKLIIEPKDKSYYIKYFSDHAYINSNLNKAIAKFDELVNSCFCPICNPIRLNENHKNPNKKGHLVQMCKTCKRMFNIIREISVLNNDSKMRFTTKKIRERIKLPNKIEATKTPEERKLKHFKRLGNLMKEIMQAESEKKDEKIQKYKNILEPLIKLQFKEFIKNKPS